MDQALVPDGFPRQPLQQRAKDRFERVVDDARELLLESGLSGFSIPELAARLGYSRATIYNFFPTPYTIFNELTRRYLTELEQLLFRGAQGLLQLSWQEGAKGMVAFASQFYNANPVARLLILGGPITDESYRAQELMIQRLGRLVQQALAQRGIMLPLSPPDVSLLAVEIGTTCFRVSCFLHGEITPQYQEEAGKAMIAYLSGYAPG
ncbi:MAG: TetR/AcrR family transcriptional regulator [Nevskia sp.]|nr:TetR/AcrR family transcriptional regulator [Nevskia sp.]